MLQYIYPSVSFVDFKKKSTDNILVLLKFTKDGTRLVYINSYKKRCYSVLIGFIMDYKKQVLIICIKANI